MELKPEPDIIVLKKVEKKSMSDGGIALPQNMQTGPNEDKIAEVADIGADVTNVKVGDKVAWTPYEATAVQFGGQTGMLYFVKEKNILAKIID
ncbi:MAG: co-chaperone GroES [Candidatus Thorarchaeota archaeon]